MTKIRGFDGLRALSVIFVILTHLGIYTVAAQAGWLSERIAPIISGGTGVQIFFVLSGFLITRLLIIEYQGTGHVSLKNFYIRRAFRILPLYYLCLALTFAIHWLVWPVAGNASFAFAATFNTSFIPREWYASILGHTWSLSVEEHFYIIWPAALLMIYRFTLDRALRHLLIAVAVSLLALAVVSRIDAVADAYFVGRWSIFAGSWIAIGCAAAIVVSDARYVQTNRFMARPAALVLGFALFVHSIVLGALPQPLDDALRVCGVALIVCWIYHNQSSRFVAALEYEPLAYTGKISYGLYMWQGLFLTTGPGRDPAQLWPLNPALGLLCLCIVAPLSYHLFEKRFLKMSAAYRASDAPNTGSADTAGTTVKHPA